MKFPEDLLYTREHEWVRVEDDGGGVGITDYAQRELGDVVFVELPKAGDSFEAEKAFGSVESVKAVSELYCPISGTVTAVNETLIDSPEIINNDPYGEGWMIRITISNRSELENLLSSKEYKEYVEEELGE